MVNPNTLAVSELAKIGDWPDDMDSSHSDHNEPKRLTKRRGVQKMNTHAVGLDIAKNVFHAYAQEGTDKAIKKKLKRKELLTFFANYPES